MEQWFVTYDVDGFGQQKAGPYQSKSEADDQAKDIAGVEASVTVRLQASFAPRSLLNVPTMEGLANAFTVINEQLQSS